MTDEGDAPSFTVRDEGIRYRPGDVVRIERRPGGVHLSPDPSGAYEVVRCTPSRTGVLHVQLRRLGS